MFRMLARRSAVLAAGTATLGLLLAGNAAASPTVNMINFGYCQALGNYATCVASGNVIHPLSINTSVYTLPNHLSVTITWSMTCSQGSGAGSRSGSFTATTPIQNHPLSQPYKYPDSCSVAAEGSAPGNSQRIRVYLSAERF